MSNTRASTTRKELIRVPLSLVVPSPENDREGLGNLDELVVSIRDHGIDVEPKITPHPSVPAGHYLTIYGHRRCAAARLAGMTEITAIVEYGPNPAGGLDDDEIERQRGEENLSRENLKPMEEARVYGRRARKVNPATGMTYTVQQVAEFFSKSQGHVSRRLALLQLPVAVQTLIDQRVIGITDAYLLSQLHEHPQELVRIVDAFVGGVLGVSIQQAVTDSKAELGVVSRSAGRPPRKPQQPLTAPVSEPAPANPAPIPAPSKAPLVPQRRGLPWSARTHVTLQVRIPVAVYKQMVRAKLDGGRYGFTERLTERVIAYIEENVPAGLKEVETPAED